MATKKFYDSYERVVTPTSKNVVLEYKGENSANFTFNVDISGKNANKYDSRYQNIATRSGDDLVIKTVFISLNGSEKIVTTTLKNYFIENLLQEIDIKSTLLKNETICIDQNTNLGTSGLYGQVGDSSYSDYILAPDDTLTMNLTNSGYDQVFDKTGDDTYYANGGMGKYFLDLDGDDSYNSSNGNITTIRDTKGDDKYLSENSGTKISTLDYKGNDEYYVEDSAALHAIDYKGNDKYIVEDNGYLSLVQDIKGNDEYYLGSHTASKILDESGNDEYEFVNAWVTTGANIIEDRYGNDEYDITKSIGIKITEYGGNDEYKIKNIDTSSKDLANPNFTILDYTGNDKYELENITSDDGQGRSYITEEAGNDSYFATNVNYVSFYDEMGNDKYNFIAGKNVTIYDYLGKDTYTLKGTESEKLSNLTINDMETNKKSASDKYILEKTDHVGITDNAGNDNYNIKESEYCTIEDYTGNDKYDLLDSEEIGIIDGAGNDKYNLKNFKRSLGNLIKDKAGNDLYTIANSWDVNIEETEGKDKYTFVGENHYISIDDYKGSDTYTSKGNNLLSYTYIYDYGEEADTYTLNGISTGKITDNGGNNKYTITNSKDFNIKSMSTMSVGKDTYNLKNNTDWGIDDHLGDDKYSLSNSASGNIYDYSGNDTYSNGNKTNLTCVYFDDQGAGNDTYKFYNYEGTIKDDGGNNTFTINNGQDVYITASGFGNDKYTLQNRINGYIKDSGGEDTYTSKGETTLWSYSITDYGTDADTYTLNGGSLLSITDEGGNNKFTISNCYESGITATGNGNSNDTYKYTNMSDCWIDDYAGNDNYNISKSWLAIIEDFAGNDIYKLTNTENSSITDSEGDDNYTVVKSKDISIGDGDGNDSYSIDIKGIKNGRYYIEDCGSGTDSLTISGLNAKNVVYLTDFNEYEKNTGDLIILDKSSKNYIQIDHFFNYRADNGYIYDEFAEGRIETIKAGNTTLNIDESSMSTHLNIISASIASWLTLGAEYDSVIEVLNSGDNNAINELIAYCQG
ncbi:hypothetical protein IKU74_06355 [bacterium]|nr:hypothetical protein [bacterium]